MGPTRSARTFNPSKKIRTPKRLLLLVISALAAAQARAQELPNLVSTVIRGSSIYSAPELFPVYSPHLGDPITNESARAIAIALADKYVADGYSRPRIRIDDRMVASGVLAIEVVEARLSAIEITGDPGPYATRLHTLGQGLNDDSLLRSNDLLSAVRRMRALSGLTLSASTEENPETPGGYRLNLDADYRPVSAMVRMTNRGTEEIGPAFLLGQVTANGMLGGRATLGFTFGSATDFDEYHGLGLTGRIRATDDDLAVIGSGFRSRSNPNESPVDRNDRYLRDRLTLGVARPLGADGTRELMLTGGMRAEDLSIFRERTGIRDERLRLVEVGMRWTTRLRPTSQFAAGFELIKGINGLGSGLHAIDLVDDRRVADFSLLTLDFVRVAQLSDLWSWRLNSLAQLGNDTLPYSERFKIGGDRLGRGFEVTEIAGDQGIGAKVELLRRLPAIPDPAGAVSVYSFYDLGAAWKNDASGRESAASAGIGLLLNGSKTDGRVEIAKPLTHADVEGRDDLRVFLELTMSW